MRGTIPTFHLAITGFTVALIVVLAIVATSELRAESDATRFTQPTVIHDETAMRSVSVLTEQQQEQAVTIAFDDQRVRNLLAARQFEVTDTIIWTGQESWTATGSKVMGAAVIISLSEPSTIEGAWLSLSFLCDQQPPPPPDSVPYTAQFAGLTSVQVFSNLTTGEVDAILPFGEDGLTRIGDRVFTGEIQSITSCYED